MFAKPHFRKLSTCTKILKKVAPDELKAKNKGVSSQHWLSRQLSDPYVEKAKRMNYRCRSAFKLIEIDDRFKILHPGQRVIDCGAAPGSWTQIAVKRVNSDGANMNVPKGKVVAIDRQQIFPVEGATVFGNMDCTASESQKMLMDFLQGDKVDAVISDMAPSATGIRELDNDNIIKLCYTALRFAVQISAKDASVLVKLWQCGELKKLENDIGRFYGSVKIVKPSSSRADSTEVIPFHVEVRLIVSRNRMNTSLSRGCSYSPAESFEYTALQFAVRRGSLEQVKYLVESGTELDTGPDPALHLALRKHNIAIAEVLLQAGADFEIRDSHDDYPIHIACALGLLEIVHTLCSLGCSVEVPTAKGLFPLHLAAKNGHVAVVRCLCAAGCNIDVRNWDNIRAEITALKYGHNDIAELLDRLRATGQRDVFARQLVPTSRPALRISLRLLGHCGVGKTSLVKSLGAGLFSSLFRRSSSLQSNKSRPSSPINTQIEMDVTSRQNSLSFESSANYQSTNGIHIQSLDISSVGDVTIWDFSGQENYFPVYHHFLWPSPYTVTAILFSLDDPPSTQVQQVCYWLNFLLARQIADLPSSEYGPILLVATHVDLTRAVKTQHGEWICPDAQKTLESVVKLLPHIPNLMPNVIIMDSNVPASYAFKQVKSVLATLKQDCIQQTIGTWTGLLEHTLAWLVALQKDYEQFPVLTRPVFADLLRGQVNLLASDDHIQELLQQLHAMGEIFCVQDLVVISVQWLGGQLLGELLSTQFLLHARVTGVYTAEDFQASYNQCDALGVLDLLEALDICVQCDIEGEVEYEFPIYNHTETLDGLWDKCDPRYSAETSQYGGLRLYVSPGTHHLFNAIFPHIQVELRRATLGSYSNKDCDLYQWHLGSKLCNLDLESLITLEGDDVGTLFVEIKIRGPGETSKSCFYFLEEIMQTLSQAIFRVCPGLLLEKHILSPQQLKMHSLEPYCYEPQLITSAMLEAESTLDLTLFNPKIEALETIIQLIMFDDVQFAGNIQWWCALKVQDLSASGKSCTFSAHHHCIFPPTQDDVELAGNIQWGCALKVQDLPAPVKLKLCGLLDPPEPHGRDWCLLALRLGLCQEKIAALDSQHSSHTMRLLTSADCSIGALISSLHELDRLDAAEVVLRSAHIFKVLEHVDV